MAFRILDLPQELRDMILEAYILQQGFSYVLDSKTKLPIVERVRDPLCYVSKEIRDQFRTCLARLAKKSLLPAQMKIRSPSQILPYHLANPLPVADIDKLTVSLDLLHLSEPSSDTISEQQVQWQDHNDSTAPDMKRLRASIGEFSHARTLKIEVKYRRHLTTELLSDLKDIFRAVARASDDRDRALQRSNEDNEEDEGASNKFTALETFSLKVQGVCRMHRSKFINVDTGEEGWEKTPCDGGFVETSEDELEMLDPLDFVD